MNKTPINKNHTITAAKIIIPILLIFFSIFVLGRYTSSVKTHEKNIKILNEKRSTVIGLTTSATTASALITALPDDMGTPIADKLADLSSYFLWILCAIFLEKYMLTVSGCIAFQYMIPIALAIYVANVFLQREALRKISIKLGLFAIALYCLVPASVKISSLVESTYHSSMQQTVQEANETIDDLEDKADDEGGISGFFSKVKDATTQAFEKVKTILNNFIEAIAFLIVTSCVIPILTLLFFIWCIKLILGISIPIPSKMTKFIPKMRLEKESDENN